MAANRRSPPSKKRRLQPGLLSAQAWLWPLPFAKIRANSRNSCLNFPIPQHLTPFLLAANFAVPQTLLKSPWLGNRPRHDEPACSHSRPAPDGSPLGVPPARFSLSCHRVPIGRIGRIGLIPFHDSPFAPTRAVGAGTLGPASDHENYETNPKQFLRIVFKCNWFPPFGRFFCPQKEPKSPRIFEDRPLSSQETQPVQPQRRLKT